MLVSGVKTQILYRNEAQTPAMEGACEIRFGVQKGNTSLVLQGLQTLSEVKVEDVSDPLLVLKELMEAIVLTEGLESSLKRKIAEQARYFSLGVLAKMKGGQIVYKETKQDLLAKIEKAKTLIDEKRRPENGLFFLLENLRVVVELLEDNMSLSEKWRDVFGNLVFFILSKGTDQDSFQALANIAYAKIIKEIDKNWFEQVFYLEFLSREACTSSERLNELQQLIKKAESGDWRTLYAGIEALAYVIEKSEDKAIQKQAYFGEQGRRGNPGLISFLDFQKFLIQNNWRIRERAANSLIELLDHQDDEIAKNCEDLLLDRKVKEKDQRVRLLLERPEYVTAVKEALKESWPRKKGEYENLLKQQKELIEAMQASSSKNESLFQEKCEELTLFSTNLEAVSFEMGEVLKGIQEVKTQLSTIGTHVAKVDEKVTETRDRVRNISDQVTGLRLSLQELRIMDIPIAERLNKIKEMMLGESILENEGMYVPVNGVFNVGSLATFDLDIEVRKFLTGDKQSLLLMGNSGSGKSTYSKVLGKELWNEWKEGDPIPVWVSLPDLGDPVKGLVKEVFSQFGFKEWEIEELKKRYSFVFIFDAYDELEIWQNLIETNKLSQWNFKMITTVRTQYLTQEIHYSSFFAPSKWNRTNPSVFQEMCVAPFSGSQIDDYLKKYVSYNQTEWKDWESYKAEIERIPGLFSLIETPFILHIVTEVLPSIVEEHKKKQQSQALTRNDLYDTFVNNWFIRQENRLRGQGKLPSEGGDIKKGFMQFSKALAMEMYKKGVNHVEYIPEEEWGFDESKVESPWKKYFGKKTALLRSGCPIMKTGEKSYAFLHKSLKEYFISRELFDQALAVPVIPISSKAAIETPQNWLPELPPPEGLKDRLIKDEAILQFLADRVRREKQYGQTLLSALLSSRQNPERSIEAANAITILNLTGFSFSGMDLSGVQIPGADLSRANLYRTNLRNANLKGVKLPFAFMDEADISGCNMENVWFGELPLFNHIYEKFCFSKDGKRIGCIQHFGQISVIDRKSEQILQNFDLNNETDNGCFRCINLEMGRAAIGFETGKIQLWDVNQEVLYAYLEGHNARIVEMRFSDDGKYLATLSSLGELFLWNGKTGEKIASLEIDGDSVKGLSFDPQSNYFAVGCDNKALVYQIDGETIHFLCELPCQQEEERIVSLQSFVPKSKLLAVVTDPIEAFTNQSCISIWDFERKTLLNSVLEEEKILSLDISPDGEFIAAGFSYGKGAVSLYSVDSLKAQGVFGGTDQIDQVTFLPNEKLLATGHNGHLIRFWDISSPVRKNEREDLKEQTVLSSDGNYLLVNADNQSYRNESAILFERKSGKIVKKFPFSCACFSPDGKWVAFGPSVKWKESDSYSLKLWDVVNCCEQEIFQNYVFKKRFKHLLFSPCGSFLTVQEEFGAVKTWDLEKNCEIQNYLLPDRDSSTNYSNVNNIFIDHHSKKIAIEKPDNIHVFDFHSGQHLSTINKKTNISDKISEEWKFHPFENYFYCQNGVWDCMTGKEVKKFRSEILCFSPSGKTVAMVKKKGALTLFDVSQSKDMESYQIPEEEVFSLTFISEKRFLVGFLTSDHRFGGSSVEILKLWDSEKKQIFETFLINTWISRTSSLSYHADQQILLLSSDVTIMIWDLSRGLESIRLLFCSNHPLRMHGMQANRVEGLSKTDHKLLSQLEAVQEEKEVEEEPIFSPPKSDSILEAVPTPSDSNESAEEMTALIAKGHSFSGKDLSGICIPGADLSGGIFHETDFRGADLTDVDFTNALLTGCNFEGAKMGGIRLGKKLPLEGHSASIISLKFSPCGKYLATAGKDKTICLWDRVSGELLQKITEEVKALCFAPNGKILATARPDGFISFWRVSSGEKIKMLKANASILSLQFSDTGKTLFTSCEDGTIKLWTWENSKLIKALRAPVSSVIAYHQEQNRLAISDGKSVEIMSLKDLNRPTREKRLQGHTGEITCLDLSPNGTLLATGGKDKAVRVFELSSDKEIVVWEGLDATVNCLAFRSDGKIIAVGTESGSVYLWDVEKKCFLSKIRGDLKSIKTLDFSLDGMLLAATGDDKRVFLWETAKIQKMFPQYSAPVTQVQLSPKGDSFAELSTNNRIHHFDTVGKRGVLWKDSDFTCLTYNHNGELLAIGDLDGNVRIFDVSTGKSIKSFEFDQPIYSLCFKPDSTDTIAIGRKGGYTFWKRSEDITKQIEEKEVFRISFRSDSKYYAYGGNFGSIQVVESSTGKKRSLEGAEGIILGLAFSPCGSYLAASGTKQSLSIWNINTGVKQQTLPGHKGIVYCVQFTSDGKYLISSGEDGTLRFFEWESGELIKTIFAHRDRVKSISLSPDGKSLLSGSDDHSIKRWNLSKGVENITLEFSSVHELDARGAKIAQAQEMSDEVRQLLVQESRFKGSGVNMPD